MAALLPWSETRFYITSLAWLAAQVGPVVRAHWTIENSLRWVMDMIFRDDECRVRADHAPALVGRPGRCQKGKTSDEDRSNGRIGAAGQQAAASE